jgi:hypothetical protein
MSSSTTQCSWRKVGDEVGDVGSEATCCKAETGGKVKSKMPEEQLENIRVMGHDHGAHLPGR